MALVRWSPDDDAASPDALTARAFGASIDDLSVDLQGPLDAAVGGVLRACLSDARGRPFSGREIAEWTLARRRQGLLAVAIATGGPERTLPARCANPGCGATAELSLSLAALRRDWRARTVAAAAPGGARFALRLPTPSDLAALRDDPAAAASSLARRLLAGPAPDAEGWEAAAEAALSQADPLADLELRAPCPDCGAEIAVAVSLERWLTGELSRASRRLMDEIHAIAIAYHWTETDIMALPESRRRHYLARIREARAA